MNKKIKGKKTVWFYAVILFTSAIIVLFVTTLSQIRFNKNIFEYKQKISTGQQEKEWIKSNLQEMVEENKKLILQIDEIEEEKKSLQNKNQENIKKLEKCRENEAKIKEAYEKLEKAHDRFLKDEIIESSLILYYEIDKSGLSYYGKKAYDELSKKCFLKASKKLYEEGYKLFIQKEYSEAIEKFMFSVQLQNNQYYSDDCYYFAGYAEYNQGKYENASMYMHILLDKYPESNYIDDAQYLLRKIEN